MPRRRAPSYSPCDGSRPGPSFCCSRGELDGQGALGARERAGSGPRPAPARRADERRCAPAVAARPARQAVRAPDPASDPRALGRQPVLRARNGPDPRGGRRPAAAVACARDPGGVLRGRLAELPAATREALALASALGAPPSPSWSAPASRADALRPAFAAHVIEREQGTIRFTHPLLSSVLYRDRGTEPGAFTSGSQASSTIRFSALVTSPSRRTLPTPASPRALDDAARLAADRGATAAAAELAEQALRLTPLHQRDQSRRALWPRHARIRLPESGRAPARSRTSY